MSDLISGNDQPQRRVANTLPRVESVSEAPEVLLGFVAHMDAYCPGNNDRNRITQMVTVEQYLTLLKQHMLTYEYKLLPSGAFKMTEVVVLAEHSPKHFIVYIRALELFPGELFSYCQQNRVSKSLRLFSPMTFSNNLLLLKMSVPLLEEHVKGFRNTNFIVQSLEPI